MMQGRGGEILRYPPAVGVALGDDEQQGIDGHDAHLLRDIAVVLGQLLARGRSK